MNDIGWWDVGAGMKIRKRVSKDEKTEDDKLLTRAVSRIERFEVAISFLYRGS